MVVWNMELEAGFFEIPGGQMQAARRLTLRSPLDESIGSFV
jgi:hypothetical protein